VYIEGDWDDEAVVKSRPKRRPPPVRVENYTRKPGNVWIGGRWEWQDGRWDWIAGRYEPEVKGRRYRPGRWQQSGEEFVFVDGGWDEAAAVPIEAPPPPRRETYAQRPGEVWIAGRWDWKSGQWEWTNGRYERQVTGRRYRPGRWDRSGDSYVFFEGDWVNETEPVDPLFEQRPRYEKPVIGNYWPDRGKPGQRVTIYGRNFSPGATVLWNGRPLNTRVNGHEQISFRIPRDAADNGFLMLRDPARGRDLGVGRFELTTFDADEELRRIEAERKQKAEAAVNAYRARFAAARNAREEALKQRAEAHKLSRDERRAARIKLLEEKWQEKEFLGSEDVTAELTLHAARLADLHQMLEMAELSNNLKLAIKIETARSREDARHDKRMETLKATFKAGGK
jgi:hypothetical protein